MDGTAAPEAANGVAPDEYTELWSKAHESDSFETWEKLIAVVLKADDIEKIRQVFNAFLSRFPLCYGYWQKYANAESRLADAAAAEAVLERGVASTPYSVELWVYYINWKRNQPDREVEHVRRLFDRASQYLANDWNLHKLWDKWIEFESAQEDIPALTSVYSSVLSLPIKELPRYQQSFMEFAANHDLEAMISKEELENVTSQAKIEKAKKPAVKAEEKGADETAAASATDGEAKPEGEGDGDGDGYAGPPGVDGDEGPPGVEDGDSVAMADVTVDAAEVKAHWLQMYSNACEAALAQRAQREPFEAAIRRFWWHYKPLDAAQLLNWWRFLDFVESSGDATALYALFERCLVACASYPEFWRRYISFLLQNDNLDIAQAAIQRACNVFCSKQPDMLLFAAAFHEHTKDVDAARAVFQKLQNDVAPRSLEVVVRHANFERRQDNLDTAIGLYEALLSEEKSHGDADVCTYLGLQYATFLCDSGKQADAMTSLDGCLLLFPASIALWKGAVALAERYFDGEERTKRVLELYDRALHQQTKTLESQSADGATQAAAQEEKPESAEAKKGSAAAQLALSLPDREVLAANACSFADECAEPAALWRCQTFVQDLHREFLEIAEASSKKRSGGSAAQPAAKRHAAQPAAHTAAPDSAAAWAAMPAQQQAQYYQQPAYDYSAYYQQQQQQQQYPGYYGGYY